MQELTDEQSVLLESWLFPDSKLRVFYNDNNVNNMDIEIRALVDNQVVYCQKNKYGERGLYHIVSHYTFELWLMDGHLSKL